MDKMLLCAELNVRADDARCDKRCNKVSGIEVNFPIVSNFLFFPSFRKEAAGNINAISFAASKSITIVLCRAVECYSVALTDANRLVTEDIAGLAIGPASKNYTANAD